MVILLVMVCQLVLTRLDRGILACPSYILVKHHQRPVKIAYLDITYYRILVLPRRTEDTHVSCHELDMCLQRKGRRCGKLPLLFETDM